MLSPGHCLAPLLFCICAAIGSAQEGRHEGRHVPAWDAVHRGSGVAAVAFSADGKLLAVSHNGDASNPRGILVWKFGPNPRDVDVLRALPTPAYVACFLAFSPDGKTLASGGELLGRDITEINLWDIGSGKEKIVLKGQADRAGGLGFTSDGALFTAAYDQGAIKVWNPSSGSEVRTIETKGQIFSMAVMPKTHRVSLAGCNGLITFFDLDSGKTTGKLQAHKNHVLAVAFAPSGKTLASFSAGDGVIHVWDTATGKKRRTLPAQKAAASPHPLAFSHDGKQLATATGTVTVDGDAATGKLNVIRVWDETTGKEVRAYRGHEESIDAVGFAPDGKTLVSGSRDRATLWDVKAGPAKKN